MKLKLKRRYKGWCILDEIPDGWRTVDAPGIPKEYRLITNGKSRFSGERKSALIKRGIL